MRVKVKLKTLAELAVLFALTVLIVYFTTWRILGKPLVYGDTPYVTLNSKKVLEEYLLHAWHREAFGNNYPWPQGHLVTLFFLYLSEITGFEELHILFNNLSFIFIPLAFYMLARDFIEDSASRIIASLLYFLNPVTITYFVSGGNLWSLALAPLAIKYYLKTLVKSPCKLQINIKYTMIAGILSAFIMMLYPPFIVPFMFMVFVMLTVQCLTYIERDYICLKEVLRVLIVFTIASLIILGINAPYVTSIYCNLKDPTLTIASSNIIADFRYRYSELSIPLLLRLAGNLGSPQTTLGYNLNTVNNDTGYIIPLLSFIGLYCVFKEKRRDMYSFAIAYITIILFVLLLRIIIFSSLNKVLLYVPLIWTMRDPFKIQQIFTLLTAMVFSAGLKKILSAVNQHLSSVFPLVNMNRNITKNFIKCILAFSILIIICVYNAIVFDGSLGLIKDKKSLKNVFVNEELAVIARSLSTENYSSHRGIIAPFTHHVELYMQFHSPNYYLGRLGLVSDIERTLNDVLKYKGAEKVLSILSIRDIIVYKTHKIDFPIVWGVKYTNIENALKNLSIVKKYKSANIMQYINPYALPIVYISYSPMFYTNLFSLTTLLDNSLFSENPVLLKAKEVRTSVDLVRYYNKTYKVLMKTYKIYAPMPFSYNLIISINANVDNEVPIFYSIDNRRLDIVKVDAREEKVVQVSIDELSKGEHNLTIGIPIDEETITSYLNVQGRNFRFLSAKSFITSNGFVIYNKTLNDFTVYFFSKLLKPGEKDWNVQSLLLCYNETKGSFYRIVFHKVGLIEVAKSMNFKYTPLVNIIPANINLEYLKVRIDKIGDTLTIYVYGINKTFTVRDKGLKNSGYLVLLSENSEALWANVTIVNYLVSIRGLAIIPNIMKNNVMAQYKMFRQSPAVINITITLNDALGRGYFYIVLNERFSKHWQIRLRNANNAKNITVKHVLANGFFNAWLIEYQSINLSEDIIMNFEIYYSMEEILFVGECISLLTMFIVITLLTLLCGRKYKLVK